MFPTVLGDAATVFVEQFDDLEEQEQYLDFLRARNFRQTLLCHRDRSLEREVTLDGLNALSVFSNLAPPKKLDLRRVKPAPFSTPDGTRFPVEEPLTKAALMHLLHVYPDAVSFPELLEFARRQLAGQGGQAHQERLDPLRGELFNLFAHQAIGLTLEPQRIFHELAERPRATALARAQAAAGLGHVATARHTTLTLDAFAARLLTYLDGTRTQHELQARLSEDIKAGELTTERASKGQKTARGTTAEVSVNCTRLLGLFARFGILQAPD